MAEATYRSSERDNEDSLVCRICLEGDPTSDALIDLRCDCKLQLSRAHTSCAQKWFRLKGSTKCEICRKLARNVEIPRRPSPAITPSQRREIQNLRSPLPSPVASTLTFSSVSWRYSYRLYREREENQDSITRRLEEIAEIGEWYCFCCMCKSMHMGLVYAALSLLLRVLSYY